MDLEVTKRFLLVKSVEEADPQGQVISLDDRAVREGEGDEPGQLGRRSERIFASLADSEPVQVQAAMAATGPHAWIRVAIVLVAFAIGLATKQLGPERRINVLAFPLFGVIAWNLLVYLWSAAAALRERDVRDSAFGRLARKIAERSIRRFETAGEHALPGGLARFAGRWVELTMGARVWRIRGSLHLGAAALSLGVIAGMYWNGLAFQYLAAWESTFLGPEGVHQLFATLFSPASTVSGIPVPGPEEIRSMQLVGGEEGSPAAPWIHLFAITVALSVVVPRAIFAWRAHRKAEAAEGAIDFRELAPDYIDQLLRTRKGGNLIARIVPHRMELGSKERDRLRSFVHHLWGGKLWVEFADPIGYGDEDDAVFGQADYQMLVMNLSATPEEESQGRLVKRFRDQLSGTGLVLLDGRPFRDRFGGLGEFERRKRERLAAWVSILDRAGIGFALFDDDLEGARGAALDALLKRTAANKDG